MAKKDRNGQRKKRNRRPPEMGYYLVVTDTKETESNYFKGLRDSLPDEIKDRLVIKIVKTETKNLIDECIDLKRELRQYCIPWIVFDRDRVPDFDKILKRADKLEIHVGWSNPCFETWMFGYFGNVPQIYDSKQCCKQFGDIYKKKTGQEYSKADKNLYSKLNQFGDEEKAIRRAKKKYKQCQNDGKTKPSEMWPCTTVSKLVEEIDCKRNDNRQS